MRLKIGLFGDRLSTFGPTLLHLDSLDPRPGIPSVSESLIQFRGCLEEFRVLEKVFQMFPHVPLFTLIMIRKDRETGTQVPFRIPSYRTVELDDSWPV